MQCPIPRPQAGTRRTTAPEQHPSCWPPGCCLPQFLAPSRLVPCSTRRCSTMWTPPTPRPRKASPRPATGSRPRSTASATLRSRRCPTGFPPASTASSARTSLPRTCPTLWPCSGSPGCRGCGRAAPGALAPDSMPAWACSLPSVHSSLPASSFPRPSLASSCWLPCTASSPASSPTGRFAFTPCGQPSLWPPSPRDSSLPSSLSARLFLI